MLNKEVFTCARNLSFFMYQKSLNNTPNLIVKVSRTGFMGILMISFAIHTCIDYFKKIIYQSYANKMDDSLLCEK